MNSSSAAATNNMESNAAALRAHIVAAQAARAPRPSFQVYQEQLTDLLNRMDPESLEIFIASHQRGFCWTLIRQQELVDTVLSGLPIPVIILFQRPNRTLSLEDGQQRLKTLKRFRNNEFPLADGRHYRDLSVEDRTHFDLYPVPVLTYRNATNQQIIDIFNRFQNGSPLSVGERLHSLAEMSPLVILARRLLLTVGEGLHDRATATWGQRAGEDKKRRNLLSACAMVAGAAFGSATLSRKWGDFERRDEHGVMSLARDIDEAQVTLKIERLLRIYERANAEFRMNGKAAKNKLWDAGTFSGYIIHSLNSLPQERWDELEARWADFIVAGRRDPSVLSVLTDTVAAARSWTAERWQTGCRAVFPDLFPTEEAAGEPEVIDDEDDESDSTE
jgi:hypothetical protein